MFSLNETTPWPIRSSLFTFFSGTFGIVATSYRITMISSNSRSFYSQKVRVRLAYIVWRNWRDKDVDWNNALMLVLILAVLAGAASHKGHEAVLS